MQNNANSNAPAVRDLVLIGGGHAHVQVLKSFGMRPLAGVRVTLISRDFETPYSGMLPGCVSGVYSEDDIHIKLAPLCRFANARFICAPVTGLDLAGQRVSLLDRPALRYDLLSINSGAVPVPPHADAITVKPISEFLPKWRAVRAAIKEYETLAIVGGGAGGVELAMAARRVLPANVAIVLVGPTLLAGHGEAAIGKVAEHLSQLDIQWVQGRAHAQSQGQLRLQDERSIAADYVLWVTDVAAPPWIEQSGLATDSNGFLTVDRFLNSTSDGKVFAAGDVAHLLNQERPKSGVYAVRAGPALTHNLRNALYAKPLKPYRAQEKHLALINCGDGQAIASRSQWAAQGKFWWWLKERIDWAFMNKFNQLPEMQETQPQLPKALQDDLPDQLMRCGGCGSKLPADPLRRVLGRLPSQASAQIILGIGDDAAQITNCGPSTLLTVDGFRAMVDDPYLFGRIATHHSLNDIFAMAATPTAGLVFATIPLMAEALVEEELFQLLSGVTDVLNAHDVPLVGGHSAEGAELGIGLTISGTPGSQTLAKYGAREGDRLIMTKALGTGVVLAAAMQGRAHSSSIEAALASMDVSNALALAALVGQGATSLTDITGFGLAGHLGEMLKASGCGVVLDIAQVPYFPYSLDLLGELHSSLQQANEGVLLHYELSGGLSLGDVRVRGLADPQTSGGLLATIPAECAEQSLRQLNELGYDARDIGEIVAAGPWRIH